MINPLVGYTLLKFGVGAGCLLMATVAWEYRTQPAGLPMVLLSLAAAGWAASSGLTSAGIGVTAMVVGQYAEYACSVGAAVSWLFVVGAQADRRWWTRSTVRLAIVGLVAGQVAIIATDPIHHLYLVEGSIVPVHGALDPTPGPLLWVNAGWELGVIGYGSLVLVASTVGRRGLFRRQAAVILIAGILPAVTAIADVFDVVAIPGLDLGVLGIGVGTGLLMWALFTAGLLDLVPVARETLLQSLTDAVIAVDATARVVELNAAAMALFDVTGDVTGTPVARVVDDRFPELPAADPVDPDRRKRETLLDDAGRRFEVVRSPLKAPNVPAGENAGTLLVFHDVTDQWERERALEIKNDRLEAFASIVSHDLRNPLNVVRGRLQLVTDTADLEHLTDATQALDRMDELIHDILTLAQEGSDVAETQPVDLPAVTRRAWANIDTADASLSITSELTIPADPSRLQQLLANLLRNAIDHGGPAVAITVGDLADGRGFYVDDDGPGIPAATRERVFESGYSTGCGTGLGLAIVREIARAHGWTVRVTAGATGGARFEFTVGGVDRA